VIKHFRPNSTRRILLAFLAVVTVVSAYKMYKAYVFAFHYIGSMPFNPRPPFYFWVATLIACAISWILFYLLYRHQSAQPSAAADAGTGRSGG
jgi:glycerol-3-phosphate acyltransferase PlsY